MAQKIESFAEDAVTVAIKDPERMVKRDRNILQNLGRGKEGREKAARSLLKGPAEATIEGFSVEAKKRQNAAEIETKKAAADKAAAFESVQSQQELEAKRKAAQDRLAMRRSTPGRPIFTTLGNQPSLL